MTVVRDPQQDQIGLKGYGGVTIAGVPGFDRITADNFMLHAAKGSGTGAVPPGVLIRLPLDRDLHRLRLRLGAANGAELGPPLDGRGLLVALAPTKFALQTRPLNDLPKPTHCLLD